MSEQQPADVEARPTDSAQESDDSQATEAEEPTEESLAEHTSSDVVARRPARRGAATFLAVLALVVALGTAATSYYVWSRQQASYTALADQDAGTSAGLAQARESIDDLEAKLTDVDGRVEAGRRSLLDVGDRLDDVPDELAALTRRIDALQGGTFDSRQRWLLAEADYYLSLANSELTLADRWDNAITALDLADRRLRELALPELAPVREAIADELLALRSVRLPDLDGIAFSLNRLAERVDSLPLRAGLPQRYGTAPPADTSEPGLTRLWNSAKEALSSLIRVERRDEPVPTALSAEEGALARRELAVELQLARVAIVRRDAQAFAVSLDAATALLKRDFDVSAAEVGGALSLLDELGAIEIAPARPDISGSLSALRRLTPGED